MATKKVLVKKKIGATPKYSKKITEDLCALIVEDDYTTDELCKKVGIDDSTFFLWKNIHPDFLEAIKKAKEKRLEVFRGAARSGLLKLLKGTEYEETIQDFKMVMQEDGTMKATPKQMRRLKKVFQPNPIAAIFALKNTDPEAFPDTDRKEITTKGPINISLID